MTNCTAQGKFNKEDFLKLVEQVSAIQKEYRIILYLTEKHKAIFEEYFNVKIECDDCEFDTIYGTVRFLKANVNMGGLFENQNQIFIL